MSEQGFTLSSPAFVSDGVIPKTLTCDGENRSPELNWIHPPDGVRSFALIVEDPDAPDGTFTHWILFDIPAETQQLPADMGGTGVGGRNDFQAHGYGGPCPPPNHGQHRYYFRLYALDIETLKLKVGAARAEVEKAMQDHVLDVAEVMGRYERTAG